MEFEWAKSMVSVKDLDDWADDAAIGRMTFEGKEATMLGACPTDGCVVINSTICSSCELGKVSCVDDIEMVRENKCVVSRTFLESLGSSVFDGFRCCRASAMGDVGKMILDPL